MPIVTVWPDKGQNGNSFLHSNSQARWSAGEMRSGLTILFPKIQRQLHDRHSCSIYDQENNWCRERPQSTTAGQAGRAALQPRLNIRQQNNMNTLCLKNLYCTFRNSTRNQKERISRIEGSKRRRAQNTATVRQTSAFCSGGRCGRTNERLALAHRQQTLTIDLRRITWRTVTIPLHLT